MTEATRQLLETALGLPADERATLAEALLDSLSAEGEDDETALRAELDRRRMDAGHGKADAVPWSKLRDET